MGSCALAETMRKPRTRKNANCFLKKIIGAEDYGPMVSAKWKA